MGPESNVGPKVVKSTVHDTFALLYFSEPVTVIGVPVVRSKNGTELRYDSGAGTNTLRLDSEKEFSKADLEGLQIVNDGKIEGTLASVHEREVNFSESGQ